MKDMRLLESRQGCVLDCVTDRDEIVRIMPGCGIAVVLADGYMFQSTASRYGICYVWDVDEDGLWIKQDGESVPTILSYDCLYDVKVVA